LRHHVHPARLWPVLGLLLGGLAAAAPARPPARPPKPPPAPPPAPAAPGLRFLALGDSYTIGERVAPAARWPAQLAALLRARGVAVAEPEIVARTGWTVDDLAAALEEAEPSGPYDLVTLQIGVNDEYRGRAAEVYRGEFRVMLRRAVAYAGGRSERVLVLSIPDWSVTPFAARRSRPDVAAEVERFNAVNREEATRAGARWVDVSAESRDAARDPALLADDGLHPAPAMYAAWARLALEPALAALGAGRAAATAAAGTEPP
jgi:lysophospholipase L1-like esterase